MNIANDIKESQAKLSALNIRFLEWVEKNPEALKRSSFRSLELNDKLFTLQPWPTFISKKTVDIFKEAGEKIFELIKTFPERVFNNDTQKMGQFFEMPAAVIEMQLDGMTEEYFKNIIGRGDFIISTDGIKCIEYNVTANLGGLQLPLWESMCLNSPLISRFIKENNVKVYNRNLVSLLLDHAIWKPLQAATTGDEINIAVIAETYEENAEGERSVIYYQNLFQQILKSKNKSLDGNFFLCDFKNMQVVDDVVFYKNKQIHVVIEMNHGFVHPKLINAFKKRNLIIINGPITGLLSNKLVLALLSDHHQIDVFTPEERRIIDTYIPWTRKVKPGSTTYREQKIENLEEFLLQNRERMVLKPSEGYGGTGVSVGPKCSPQQWQIAVTNALHQKNWLAQEMVTASNGLYMVGEEGYVPHDMVWGFFIFGNSYSGAWVRVMPQENNKGVVNCHQGATVSIIFEVDE